jgi:predicted lactoylglutathione lyase
MIFVNVPVRDLDASVRFFTKLGFEFDPRFTDERATCMVVNDQAFVMLLVEEFFQSFTTKQVCDATAHAEAIFALSAESREDVDELVDEALAGGGSEPVDRQDQGWMYQRSFQDLDGHLWEVIWMDPDVAESGPPA